MGAPFSRFAPQVYAIFRIVVGLTFMMHGTQKLLGWPPGGHGAPGNPQMWIGAVIELLGGALVMIGLFAGWAAFVASGEMAVAYFQFHVFAANSKGPLPIQNEGESAVLYCFAFLLIAAYGSGIWSVQPRRTEASAPRTA
jgi:putative oxidoreductase